MNKKLKVVSYKHVGQFLRENESILLEKEAVSQLILFNAMANRNSEASEAVLFGKVEAEAEKPLLIFSNVRPYNLLIHGVTGNVNAEAVAALTDYIIDNNIEIKGLNAAKAICDLFIAQYKAKRTQAEFKEHLAMDIMELKKPAEVKLAEGISRKALAGEEKRIARWITEFAGEALGETLVYEDQVQKAVSMIEAGRLYVFENPEGEMVSMAAASRQLISGVCVNYVYTPKQYRGKGYAAANMYYLSKEMLDKGNSFCTLFVDKKNPVSNRVYKKIGYGILGDQYDYRLFTR